MAYTKNTNFTAKDALASGNPSKIIKGTELDVEFTEIATESAKAVEKAANNTLSGDNTLSGNNTFSGDNTHSGDNTFSGTNSFQATAYFAKGVDIASATALTLGTDGNYFDVTGTAAITSINTWGIGTPFKLHFDGILILTHHATDLILPGGANITTAAGDEAEFVEYASGDFRCTSYTKADGTALVGGSKIVQIVNTQDGAVATGTTITPLDDSIPQITEGDEYMTLAITPTNASNKLVIRAGAHIANSGGNQTVMALHVDADADALSVGKLQNNNSNVISKITLEHYMTAGSTSAMTFRIRIGATTASTTTFNGASAARLFGGVINSYITITEVSV